MSLVVDLHSHTYYSDGTLSPVELVKRAHSRGVDVLALTDHDDTSGLTEAMECAQSLGLNLINGVEVSVSWEANQTIHIVGLNIDPSNKALQDGLLEIREERVRRAKKIAKKMQACGIENVWSEITEQAGFEAVTRTHFARYLLEKGEAKDMQHAFKKWLGRNGKSYVNGHWISLARGVELITQAGGIAVIAHPLRYKMTRRKLERLITDFKQAGGKAIEVAVNRCSDFDKTEMAKLAVKHDLLASVGSDFHTPGSPYIDLGQSLSLPKMVKPVWFDWTINGKQIQ